MENFLKHKIKLFFIYLDRERERKYDYPSLSIS